MGGEQSLNTNLYDEVIGFPTPILARVVRNTQLVLREETGITEVADLRGGCYMMEIFTDDLYDRSMDILRDVEEEGGGV